MSSEEPVLSFEIVIDAKLSAETKRSIEELKQAKEDQENLEEKLLQDIEDEVNNPSTDVNDIPELDELDEKNKKLEQKVDRIKHDTETKAQELEEKLLQEIEDEVNNPSTDVNDIPELDDTAKDFAKDQFTPGQTAKLESMFKDKFGGIDAADLAQVGAMAKNPTSFISKIMKSGAAKILGPIGIALIAVATAIEVIKLLSVKGGPLNRDWRRFISAEVAVGLSREQQLEDRFGVSQTILTQIRGFAPNNENWTYNNLFDVNDERIARIGMSDREAGVTMFIP